MPTAWETFPVEVKGGLITNISPLQQGIQQPGSARSLVNFEPSIEGGYRRLLGYTKFDDAYVPPYGEPLVQGSGQSGTTLVLANIFIRPNPGDTLTIAGVDGTYTVDDATFDSVAKTVTLTLEEALDSSPADKAAVTFGNTNSVIQGLIYYRQRAVAYRGADIFRSDGSGWQKISKPSYGSVLVDGASQTGTSLTVDGLTGVPQQGDTFIIAGVEKVYTIVSSVTVMTGGATLSISPALDTSPADNAALTFLSCDRSLGLKHSFTRYNFTGSSTVMGVDGVNKPFKYDNTTFKVLSDAPSDVVAARHVVDFKNHIFFAKGNFLSFTAPYTDDDFSIANGAGVILVPHTITGLIVFREQLIVFSTNTIHRLIGNTVSDFQLQPISQDIGCVREDTIQEVGGDVAFLGPDGVRLLSATDRIGDFGLAVASRPIQSEVKNLVDSNTSFSSCVVRAKNQYRLFGYSGSRSQESSSGVLATQFADQTAEGMAWAEIRGIMSYVADSIYSNLDGRETIIFANRDGYVYRMEAGNSFDGNPIRAFFYTPFWAVTDPRVRKTFYKLTTYIDPSGRIEGSVSPRLDFDEAGVIQPPPVSFETGDSSAAIYGRAIYGVSRYGSKLKNTLTNNLIGSGFTFSLEYQFTGITPPFSIDAVTVEYLNNDRQ
jgi:hypothetical protein